MDRDKLAEEVKNAQSLVTSLIITFANTDMSKEEFLPHYFERTGKLSDALLAYANDVEQNTLKLQQEWDRTKQ